MVQSEDGSRKGIPVSTTVPVVIGIVLACLVALWFLLRPAPKPGPGATLEIPSSMAPAPSHAPAPARDPFVSSPAPLGK